MYLLRNRDDLRSPVMTLNGRDLVLGEKWEGTVEIAPGACAFIVL